MNQRMLKNNQKENRVLLKYICKACGTSRFLTIPKEEVLCAKCNKPMEKEIGNVSTAIDSTPESRFISEEAIYGRIEKSIRSQSRTSKER